MFHGSVSKPQEFRQRCCVWKWDEILSLVLIYYLRDPIFNWDCPRTATAL